jgi:dTDP-4-amino-4,6-dideoxygalactose transaminase
MLNTPFSPWPSYSEEEIEAVTSVLKSNKVNYWTGEECRLFEKEFAHWCNTEYAISLANGTVALELAFRALGIGSGDEVIVTSRTFIASVSSIIAVGARPVFADIDPVSQNITAETIQPHISTKTKAILCVHLAGWPCDMEPILSLAKEHDVFVVEDCAQAHGAKYKGLPVGSLGDIGCWSFCQDKIMTTGGEGGMVTTNNEQLWKKMWSYKDHGKSWDAVNVKKNTTTTEFRWLHESFGTNWRMTEMQAAIGRIQLKHVSNWQKQREQNSLKILNIAGQFPEFLRVHLPPASIKHAWYKCYLFIKPEFLSKNYSREKIIFEITLRGVPCYSGSCSEVYLEKAFENTGFAPEKRLAVAKELGETSLMFLVHPTLKTQEMDKTIAVLDEVFSNIKNSLK